MIFSNYQYVNDMQAPFAIFSSGEKMFMKVAFTEIKFDTEIDDNVFELK